MSASHKDNTHQANYARSPGSLPPQQNNLTFSLSPKHSTNLSFIPPDPFFYTGPDGIYRLSNYQGPTFRLPWVSFYITLCVLDLWDAIASREHQAQDAYPNGFYSCEKSYTFPYGPLASFRLVLTKVPAPDWSMTYSDLVDDIEALQYAAMWFDDPFYGFPAMDIQIVRFKSGYSAPTFVASRGSITLSLGNGQSASLRNASVV
ncbi:hypothetical protein MMC28_007565 [Mycoblastus sanguinarius]|nr:hypothetical protein [Mycoblastus sanguinarius]